MAELCDQLAVVLVSGRPLIITDHIDNWDALVAAWLPGALALAGLFLVANLALQFDAARLPANATAVIMISEVVFASVSWVWLGASTPGWSMAVGGALIVGASLLAARRGP